jgi:hypothetical protein
VCPKCENDKKKAVKKAQRDLDAKMRREANMQKHLKEVARLDEEIAQVTQEMENLRLDKEQRAILTQKQKDLEAAKERANRIKNSPAKDSPSISGDSDPSPRNEGIKKSSKSSTTPEKTTPHRPSNLQEHIKIAVAHSKSSSKMDWQRQKDQENANNPAIDAIMEMIGLESVKEQVLRIKSKVETSIRQGTDLRKERLGLVLLGNPGTGIFLIRVAKMVANSF